MNRLTMNTLLRTRNLVPVQNRGKSTMSKINKVLIANRGEIACRVLRTARRLGLRTVAVYSEADQHALHVTQADEAYKIGPPPAAQSYLRGEKLLEIAQKSGCQAIHPGYGFLSENVEFAESCENSNVIFIGPPATAIRDMGIKSKSKEIMSAAGVPIIEGYHGDDQSPERLKRQALRIGFPVMIKAVRGGGGKGMRIALTERDFDEALQSAKSEAQKSFADDVMLLERFVAEPRHVEVQVFADTHGNAVHLFERDCSVQRRHQKIIEEAPAPGISSELRLELGAAAVRAAKAVGYVGAGTVEFILDRVSHSFHFMEMNTRLQVEHPITEMITGTDLVEWQLKVANGEKLPLTQDQIKIKGHSFEARVYAEDPSGGFLPGAGRISYLNAPALAQDVRIETGVRQGDEVSVYYDPMIAKLVVFGQERGEALLKLKSLLLKYHVAGFETNVNFLLDLVRHPEFAAGNVHTNFITEHYDSLFQEKTVTMEQIIQAVLGLVLVEEQTELQSAVVRKNEFNPFVTEARYRPNYHHIRTINLKIKDNEIAVKVKSKGSHEFEVQVNGGQWQCVQAQLHQYGNENILISTLDTARVKANVVLSPESVSIFDDVGKTEFQLEKPVFSSTQDDDVVIGSADKAIAPMPGVIDKILVKPGDVVKKGDSLFVLIAMKMEHIVKASRSAVIDQILFSAGENVLKDGTVIKFKEE